MATPKQPGYDPMNYSQITGGVPIPSWVFNQQFQPIEAFDSQRNELQKQEGVIQAQQDAEVQRERQRMAQDEYAAKMQGDAPFEDKLAGIKEVMLKYAPEEAMKLDFQERRDRQQQERADQQGKAQFFKQLFNINPQEAGRWAQQQGLADDMGIGGLNLSSFAKKEKGEKPDKISYETFYDPTLKRELKLPKDHPETLRRFNEGELLSKPPEKGWKEEIEEMRAAVKGAGVIDTAQQAPLTTSVETKVQGSVPGGTAPRATPTPAPRISSGPTARDANGNVLKLVNGAWVPG